MTERARFAPDAAARLPGGAGPLPGASHAPEAGPADRSRAPRVIILGTRGIPAAHGGFETFAERLAPHLAAQGWDVTVACQAEDAGGPALATWCGVRLAWYRPRAHGPLGTVEYDLRGVVGALRDRTDVALTLGYNTAVLGLMLRAARVPHLINMDGIEWRRSKWSRPVQGWFWLNERVSRFAADHLIADHPGIADHLARHVPRGRITVIPYGADLIADADPAPVTARLGIAPRAYVTCIARLEPENSILEIVAAFSRRRRGLHLVVLGRLEPERNAYHAAIRAAASEEVLFPGAIYDDTLKAALRRHTVLYAHGHRVGGTNPSLLEALGAGNPVLAHDNGFNRWVAGAAASYFTDTETCATAFDRLLGAEDVLEPMRRAARARHAEAFTWGPVLAAYEALLASWLPPALRAALQAAPAGARAAA